MTATLEFRHLPLSFQLNRIMKDQLYELFDYLQKRELWKFHAFLRVIAINDQKAGITIIGLDPKDYTGL